MSNIYDPGDGSEKAVRIVNRDGSAISAGGGGGTSATDDGAFTVGVSSVTPIGALADETSPDSVDEGDVGAVRMTLARGLHVNLRDDAGDSAMDGTNNAVRVNIVAGSSSGTEYTEDAAAADSPAGGALILVRDDARGGSLTSTDGDNVAARGTDAGELYVKHVDAIPVTDNGGALTVDGTVAVTNAGLTELAAAINASSQVDVNIAASGATVPVSNAGLTELAAAINASSQVDVNIAASGATVPVSHAALTELAAAIDTEVQVDIVAALPAGDNNIGNVDIASALPAGTNNIGDVDVLSVVPGTGATNLGKAEDAAHSSGDVGVMALAVRQDSHSDLGADGDYVPLTVDGEGGLRVTIVAGAGSGGTAAADDADFTDGTTQGTPAMGVYESTPTTVTDGDLGVVGITEQRALKVALFDAAGEEVSVGGGTQYDEDTAHSSGDKLTMAGVVRADTAAAQSGTDGDRTVLISDGSGRLHVNVGTSALPSGAATAANQTTVIGHLDGVEGLLATIDADTGNLAGILTAVQLIDDAVFAEDVAAQASDKGVAVLAVRRDADTSLVGTDNDYANLQVDANGRLKVEAFSGETLPVSLAALPSSTNTLEVVGDAAHDAAVAGNPVLVGLEARTSNGTAVANGDAVRAVADTIGKQVVLPYAIPGSEVGGATSAITGTTSTEVLAAAGAGVRNYVTSILVTNSHATVGTLVTITDGSGGTTLYAGYAAADGGGWAVTLPTPIKTTANTALHAVCGTTGSNVYVSAAGYTAP